MQSDHVDPLNYHHVNKKLNEFFESRQLVECYLQNRLQCLAACENIDSIATFEYAGSTQILHQTNQMLLEEIILCDKDNLPGFYCTTTSYRQEKDPIPGRHALIFPMKEFEIPQNFDGLIQFEKDLLEHLGFGPQAEYVELDYRQMCRKYQTEEIDHQHELMIQQDYGNVVFLKHFDERSNPFFNMKRDADRALKVDVLLCGVETIGSAERECDIERMRRCFYEMSDGLYAKTLFEKFGRERIVKELDDYLGLPMKTRSGAGIGITRLIRAMKIVGIL